MKIPNHSLFSEKICNLQESGGAVYEVVVVFNLENNSNSLQMKIDEFFERVKSYAIVENKADWQVRKKERINSRDIYTKIICFFHRDVILSSPQLIL